EARVAYMLLIMAMLLGDRNLLPSIGVTALIPVFSARLISATPNMLFIGGLMLAISVEFWNICSRTDGCLLVLQLGRCASPGLAAAPGLHAAHLFMVMWISNTATAAMMLPIVDAVLQELMVYDQLRKAEAAQARLRWVPTDRG
uniref:CitMHS domain-containing protein n=1 Tax=Macrostomum lignano TaxID=282301 RepID=A0A1I8FP70_9PLAT